MRAYCIGARHSKLPLLKETVQNQFFTDKFGYTCQIFKNGCSLDSGHQLGMFKYLKTQYFIEFP